MLLILRLILIILVIRAVLMLARGMIAGAKGQGRVESPRQSGQLVRDPVCGVYVTPTQALTERSGVGTAYFCSEACRQEWRRR